MRHAPPWIRLLPLSFALAAFAPDGGSGKGQAPSSSFKAKVSTAGSFEASGDGQRTAVARWKKTSSATPELLVVQLRTAPPEDSFELVFTVDATGKAPEPEVGVYTLRPLDAVGHWIRNDNYGEFYSDKGTLEVKESDAEHIRGTFDVSGKCGRRREGCRIEGDFELRRENPAPPT
jgi:hypothetical protein